jgi:hypothetical protein
MSSGADEAVTGEMPGHWDNNNCIQKNDSQIVHQEEFGKNMNWKICIAFFQKVIIHFQ